MILTLPEILAGAEPDAGQERDDWPDEDDDRSYVKHESRWEAGRHD